MTVNTRPIPLVQLREHIACQALDAYAQKLRKRSRLNPARLYWRLSLRRWLRLLEQTDELIRSYPQGPVPAPQQGIKARVDGEPGRTETGGHA